jgi:GAF domain
VGFCYLRQEGCRGTDLRKQSDSEAIKNMQHTVTQILAAAATVEEATPKILRALGEWLGWDVGALWRVDQEAGVLRCVEVWHKPSKEVPEFESASRERTFLAGVGLPGKVWLSRKPRYISDLVREANFQRTPVAARERLHAAFGFPILLGVAKAEGKERSAAHIKVGAEGRDTRRDIERGFEAPVHHGETHDDRRRPNPHQHDQRERAKDAQISLTTVLVSD